MQIARACAVAIAAAVVATATAPAAVAEVTKAGAGQFAGMAVGAHGLPYTDPDQDGLLTLCGTNLKPITSGSIDSKPFVWRVVSSMHAPKGYFIKGAKAQMFAYQPRPYTPAGAWSGMVMAAASLYSNAAHPMAQFTPIDLPLKDLIESYPPIWHHLYELRLYLGAPDLTEFTNPYAAADIAVHGSTWSLVYGGHASCTTGRVESVETVVGMPGAKGTPKPAPSRSASPGTSASGPASPSSPGPSGSVGAIPVASSRSSGSSAAAAIAVGVVALVILATVPGVMLWRRRRRATG
jgi:hypothetical protein